MVRGAFDAAVIGAGPAGSATARYLTLHGWRVALLERSHFDQPRIGESLAPEVQQPLRHLDLWSEFLALGPLPSQGTCSVWGSAAQQSHPHLLSPYGCGWHVDRRRFDHMLARGAVAAGTSLFEGVALRHSVHFDGWWQLQTIPSTLRTDTPTNVLRARVLIDATGRRAQVAHALGARRIVFDRLVGVAARWAGIEATELDHLLVEAAPEGWWYSAPLPGGAERGPNAMITMLMTDADLCGRQRFAATNHWETILQSTQVTRRRLGRSNRVSMPLVHCAQSQRLRHDPSNVSPWLAVGDAALAVDPISGSGVLRALRTARAAADTVNELLARPRTSQETLAAYEADRDDECTNYLIERAHYYAAERRFDTPFWQRRHVLGRRLANAAESMEASARTPIDIVESAGAK